MLHLWAFRLAFLDLFASFVDEKSCPCRVILGLVVYLYKGVKYTLKFVGADSLELEGRSRLDYDIAVLSLCSVLPITLACEGQVGLYPCVAMVHTWSSPSGALSTASYDKTPIRAHFIFHYQALQALIRSWGSAVRTR